MNAAYKQLTKRLERWAEKKLFPRSAEIRLLNALGGSTLTIGRIRSPKTKQPMTLILSRGRLLRRKRFERMNDSMFLFGSKAKKYVLALQTPAAHRDIVAEMETEDNLHNAGWHVSWIAPEELQKDPRKVRHQVLQFLH